MACMHQPEMRGLCQDGRIVTATVRGVPLEAPPKGL